MVHGGPPGMEEGLESSWRPEGVGTFGMRCCFLLLSYDLPPSSRAGPGAVVRHVAGFGGARWLESRRHADGQGTAPRQGYQGDPAQTLW